MIVKLFNELKQLMYIDTSARRAEKELFVQIKLSKYNLMAKNYNFTPDVEHLLNIIDYSKTGVIHYITDNLGSRISQLLINIIIDRPELLDAKLIQISYLSRDASHTNTTAVCFSNLLQPMAIINATNQQLEVINYADQDELQAILKRKAISNIIDEFTSSEANSETAEIFFANITKLESKDAALITILQTTTVCDEQIRQSYNVEQSFDKILRSSNIHTLEDFQVILSYLSRHAILDEYVANRLEEKSVLTELAKDQLKQAVRIFKEEKDGEV